MARTSHPVFRALKRWEAKGLLDEGTAGTLRRELEEEVGRQSRNWFQYLLSATGGAMLIVAGSTFLAWVWPEMGYAGQSVTLALLGCFVLGLGYWLAKRERWLPVAYLLQIAGAILLLMAFIYSENAWGDGTPGGWSVGILGLLLPALLLWMALGEHEVLVGLQAALSLLFLYVFLDRGLGFGEEAVLWTLDVVVLVILAILAYRLREPPLPAGALSVFMALVFSAFVLIFMSSDIIWDLEAKAMYPADLWLLLVAGLTLWGLGEGAPRHLRRDWYEPLLALWIVVGIAFAFITVLETLDAGPTSAALTVAALGALGLWYGIPRGARWVVAVSCLALFVSAWYWGAEMSGALGAVLALLVVSGALFWGATRLGGPSFPGSGDLGGGGGAAGERGRQGS